MGHRYPSYGVDRIWTYVKLRGHVLPVVAADDQYCVAFPDGSRLWVERWDCESAFDHLLIPGFTIDRELLKRREMNRVRDGFHRNVGSTQIEIDLAFERNAGKFED